MLERPMDPPLTDIVDSHERRHDSHAPHPRDLCSSSAGRLRPITRAAGAARLAFVVGALVAVAMAFAACESGGDPAGEGAEGGGEAESASAGQLDMTRPVPQFIAMRMNEIAETRLQQYLDEDKGTYARRLCEIARRRHDQVLEKYPDAEDVKAAWERVDEACGTTVAEMMLSTFLKRAQNAGESQRDMTCAAGSNALAFAHTHRRDTDRIVQLRTDIFAECPKLENEWNYVEQGGPAGGAPPGEMPSIPGMPDMPPPGGPGPGSDGGTAPPGAPSPDGATDDTPEGTDDTPAEEGGSAGE